MTTWPGPGITIDSLPSFPSRKSGLSGKSHDSRARFAAEFVRWVLRARAQAQRRRFNAAKRSALMALALEPANEPLQALLRDIERERVRARLSGARSVVTDTSKSEDSAYSGEGSRDVQASKSSGAVRPKSQTSTRVAPVGAADADPIKVSYRRGLELFRTDREGSRLAFERVLELQPDHPGARYYLRRLSQE